MILIGKENLGNYIPQRPPFLMVDVLTGAAADRFTTEFLIQPDNIFLENGVLREFGLIENIAQSSSAGLAFTSSTKNSKKADGVVGSISKLVLYTLPGVQERVHTDIRVLARFENLYLIWGSCQAGGRELLACEMKLAGI